MDGSGVAAEASSFKEVGSVEEYEAVVGGLAVTIGLEDSSMEV